MKHKKTIFFFSLFFFIFAVSFSLFHPALAQYQNQEKIPGAEPTSEFITYLKSIINFGYAVIGILALFMLIIGAYQYLIAAGTGNVSAAKETVASALLGLILGLCGYIILNKINPDLVSFRSITQIQGIDPPVAVSPNNNYSFTINPNLSKTYTLNAPAEIQQMIAQAATEVNMPLYLAMNLVNAESGGDPNATSPKGAMGLTQLMSGTAASLGVTNPYDPYQNAKGGFTYFMQQYKRFEGLANTLNINPVILAAAAYNAGPENVVKYNGVPPFKETQNFVKKVAGGQ
jgi:hypothetical protein